jgi:ABC-type transporter Mla subunit MlaD
MASEEKYFKLGLFALGASAILTAGVVLLGAGSLFEKSFPVETYVDESIQGLDVGAPVKFRGVRVGELQKIDFVAKHYNLQDPRIRLEMKFHPESLPKSAQGDPVEVCTKISAEGMRVRLASAGLTGGVYLELDVMDAKEHPAMPISWTPEDAYIPSMPSVGARLTTHVENILEHIEKMRLDQISEKVVALLDSVDALVKKVDPAVADIKTVAVDADALVKDARRVINEDFGKELKSLVSSTRDVVEKEVGPAVKSLHEQLPATFEKIQGTLDRVAAMLRRVDRTLGEDGGSMDETLDNLRVATGDLRELMGQVKRYPTQALFGEAPPKKGGSR